MEDRVIQHMEPWKKLERRRVRHAGGVDWFEHRRRLEPIGDMRPAEFEALYWPENAKTDTVRLRNRVSDEHGAIHCWVLVQWNPFGMGRW